MCFLHVIDREATSFPSDRETVVCAVLADNTRPLAQRVSVSDRLPVVANSERVVDELARVNVFSASRRRVRNSRNAKAALKPIMPPAYTCSSSVSGLPSSRGGRVGELGGEAVPRTV